MDDYYAESFSGFGELVELDFVDGEVIVKIKTKQISKERFEQMKEYFDGKHKQQNTKFSVEFERKKP